MYWSDEALDFPPFLSWQMSLRCYVLAEYSLIRLQFSRIRNYSVHCERPRKGRVIRGV
ncbi:MAG: hypothetical protein QOK33_1688 [Mycobacterium sp.]|jgi:hypothetical protein|nr:hypothetical protein [Mycobacterium sp.]